MLEGCTLWPEEYARYYREKGCWLGETFGDILDKQAITLQDKIAISYGDEHISYAKLNKEVDKLANGFMGLGIQQYDKVVVQLPNTPEFFTVCFALFKIGALPVFSLPSHRSSEIKYFCEFTNAVAYIMPGIHEGYDYHDIGRMVKESVSSLEFVIVTGDTEEFTRIRDVQEYRDINKPIVNASDIAFFQLSGGSTGLPKLIPRTHDDYIYSLRRSNDVCDISQRSVYLAALPVAHNFPLSSPGVLGTLYAGGRVVLTTVSSPDQAFPTIEKEKVTITALVPPIALIWTEAAKSRSNDLSSLEVIQVGGAKFSSEVAKKIKPTFGCQLQQVFGMAEGLVNYTRLDDPDEVINCTQGKPMSRYDEIMILDDEDKPVSEGEVGHLLTRGPYTIRGYYKAEKHNQKAFTPDGFYRTGDIAKLDRSGYLTVEGRNKDQINRGGEKIAAEEIENHLLSNEVVHDAAVVAMPDKFLGERSCAYIIPKSKNVNATMLKEYLKNRGIATYKIPDRFEFIESFPKTAFGKVSKKNLRNIISNKHENRSGENGSS